MELLQTLRRIRAFESEVTAQLVLETYVAWAVAAEREACAALCEGLNAFDMDDPGQTAAGAIRSRKPDRFKISPYPSDFVPQGARVFAGVDYGSSEGDCTTTGFYDPGTDQFHIQEIYWPSEKKMSNTRIQDAELALQTAEIELVRAHSQYLADRGWQHVMVPEVTGLWWCKKLDDGRELITESRTFAVTIQGRIDGVLPNTVET